MPLNEFLLFLYHMIKLSNITQARVLFPPNISKLILSYFLGTILSILLFFLYFGIGKIVPNKATATYSDVSFLFECWCFWMKWLREWFSDPFTRKVNFCYCCPTYQSIANYKYIHLYYISKFVVLQDHLSLFSLSVLRWLEVKQV